MIEFAAQTNTGKRLANEDSMFAPNEPDALPLILVADGMGGHAAGKRASTLAADGIVENLNFFVDRFNPSSAVTRLRAAIHTVNRNIFHSARVDTGCRGMGTTLTLALLFPDQYVAANIGDSRLYHLDEWTFAQVTQDHSLVAVLVRNGQITKEEAHEHPQRNIITRALGTSLNEEADYFQRRWNVGDILLACSDGLHGSLSEERIEALLRVDMPLQQLCDTLIENALDAGALDNVTVVLARNKGCAP